MTIQTTIGKTYAVTSAAECTITTPDGALIATCQPGVQTCIIAPTAEIEISNDAALVTESFKGASTGSAAGGGAFLEQKNLTDIPVQTTLDNYECYGISFVAGHTGMIKNITLQARDNRTILGTPVYLKIWDGETKQLLATSISKAAQILNQPTTWTFAPFNITTGKQLLVTAHTEEEKNTSAYKTGAGLSLRVTPNRQPNTGLLAKNGTISPVGWIALYIIAYKGGGETSVNGVILAQQTNLDAHTQDTVQHITDAERTSWNNKADASALSTKVNTSTFNAHTGNAAVHVTAEERATWDAKQDKLVSDEGNMYLTGHFLTFNGAEGGWIGSQYDHIWLVGGNFSYTNELTVHVGNQLVPYANLEKEDSKSESLNNKSILNRRELDVYLHAMGHTYLIFPDGYEITIPNNPALELTIPYETNNKGTLNLSADVDWAQASASPLTPSAFRVQFQGLPAEGGTAIITVSMPGLVQQFTVMVNPQ